MDLFICFALPQYLTEQNPRSSAATSCRNNSTAMKSTVCFSPLSDVADDTFCSLGAGKLFFSFFFTEGKFYRLPRGQAAPVGGNARRLMAVSCVTDAVVSREQEDIPFKIHENSIERQLRSEGK